MKWLGLSAFAPASAAVLAVDGRIIAAAHEESFSSVPRDPSFPRRAAGFCLRSAKLAANDLDGIVWFEKPLKEFETMLLARLQAFPRESGRFTDDLYAWLSDRLWIRSRIVSELGLPRDRVYFVPTSQAIDRAIALAHVSNVQIDPARDPGGAAALGAVLLANDSRGGEAIESWPKDCGPIVDDADLEGGALFTGSKEALASAIRAGRLVGCARGGLGFLVGDDPSRVLLYDVARPEAVERARQATFGAVNASSPRIATTDPEFESLRRAIPTLGIAAMKRAGETTPHDASSVFAFARRAGLDALWIGERWFSSVGT